jgi:hypothetical protein
MGYHYNAFGGADDIEQLCDEAARALEHQAETITKLFETLDKYRELTDSMLQKLRAGES